MKHLKKYNESNNEIQNHIYMVKDLFQDIIDDNNISNFGDSGYTGLGMYYTITDYDKTRDLQSVRDSIWLDIFSYSGLNMAHWNDLLSLIESKPFKDFIERLESIGYKIQMGSQLGRKYITSHEGLVLINYSEV